MIPTARCTDVMQGFLLNLRITHHYIDPYPYHHAFLDLEVHQDQQQMAGRGWHHAKSVPLLKHRLLHSLADSETGSLLLVLLLLLLTLINIMRTGYFDIKAFI